MARARALLGPYRAFVGMAVSGSRGDGHAADFDWFEYREREYVSDVLLLGRALTRLQRDLEVLDRRAPLEEPGARLPVVHLVDDFEDEDILSLRERHLDSIAVLLEHPRLGELHDLSPVQPCPALVVRAEREGGRGFFGGDDVGHRVTRDVLPLGLAER